MSTVMCSCPNCGQEISVDENLIGVEFSCPLCSEPVLVQVDEEPNKDASAEEQKLDIAQPKLKIPQSKLKIPVAKRQPHTPGKRPQSSQNTPPVTEEPVKATPSENLGFPAATPGGSVTPSGPGAGMDGDQNIPPGGKSYASSSNNGESSAFLTPRGVINILILLVVSVFFAFSVWNSLRQRDISEKQQKLLTDIAEQAEKHTIFLTALVLPNYEYKVVRVDGVSASDISNRQFLSSEIQTVLNRYNDWELVDVVTEIETKFPNFGNSGYVTGIKPNTRTCSARLILRKRR